LTALPWTHGGVFPEDDGLWRRPDQSLRDRSRRRRRYRGGAGLDIAAGQSTGISIDYLAINDKRDYLELKDVHDKLLSLKIWQRFTPSIKATALYRHQNSEARDLTLRLLGTFPAAGTEFSANYLRQFNTQESQSNPLSPFVDVVGPSEPFQTTEIKVRQFMREKLRRRSVVRKA